MMHAAANDLGLDQAEFRRINLVRDEQFPHRTPFGSCSTPASTRPVSTSA